MKWCILLRECGCWFVSSVLQCKCQTWCTK